MAPIDPDRTGYTVITQGDGVTVCISYAVTRDPVSEEDSPVGLGAFATQALVDAAIAKDRAELASQGSHD